MIGVAHMLSCPGFVRPCAHLNADLFLWQAPSAPNQASEQVAAAAQLLDQAQRRVVLEAAQKAHYAGQPAAAQVTNSEPLPTAASRKPTENVGAQAALSAWW